MTSSRPYLLRAIHQWIIDNGCTPHLLVNAWAPGVQVPTDYVENDKIVLNVGPSAAYQLELGDDAVTFDARFGGESMSVIAPIGAVLAIYARENGQGMLFTDEDGVDEDEGEVGADATDRPAATHQDESRRPNLRVVK